MRFTFFRLVGVFLFAFSCSFFQQTFVFAEEAPIITVDRVPLKPLLGQWYLIAYIPGRGMSEKCDSATMILQYHPKDASALETESHCTLEGKEIDSKKNKIKRSKEDQQDLKTLSEIPGTLIIDPRWFLPWQPYRILAAEPKADLRANNAYFVVGGPSRKKAVIYSRSPKMDETVYQEVLNFLEGQGYKEIRTKIYRVPANS